MSSGAFACSLGWGIATGAATGALVGGVIGVLASFGGYNPLVIVLYLVAGAVVGAGVAVTPSLIGAVIVAAVLARRHPQPASPDAVGRDLTVVFATVVGILDAAVLLAIATGATGGLPAFAGYLLMVGVANAGMVPILRLARRSITRWWTRPDGPAWA